MKKKIAQGIVLTLLLIGMFALTSDIQQVKAELETWTIEYDGSVLPQNADPPWITGGYGFESTDGDILTLNTIGLGCEQKEYGMHDIVNSTSGITVEARVKIGAIGNEGTIPDTAFGITDSTRAYKLVFLEDRIAEGKDSVGWESLDNYYLMDTVSDFHIYRISLQNDIAEVYVDGVYRLTLAGIPYTRNYVNFGDVRAGCGGMNGLSNWDYVKIDTSGAKPPTPQEALEELIETIETSDLPKGTKNSLTSKLKAAIHLLNQGNENGAVHKLMDFIDQVEALRDEKLTNEQADYLISEAQRIIDLIEG